MSRIEIESVVEAPIGRVFDLARSVDAHVASVPGTDEQAIAGKTSGLMELGDEVTWRARHFGVMQELTSRITIYDRPNHFRDSMVKGAFKRFDHDHFFEKESEDKTRCRDVFDFEAPLGLLGKFADHLFLDRYMRHFLNQRIQLLKTLAEGTEYTRYLSLS